MASSNSVNPKREFKDVHGYVHNVSDVKIPKSGKSNVRYFDFSIQEGGDDMKRAVCFSPEKGYVLKEKEVGKTPVSLLNVSPQKRKYQPDETEYKMNSYCKIVARENLSFPWKDRRSGCVANLKDVSGDKTKSAMLYL